MEHFPGGTPRKEDLDAVVPDRPVFLMNRDVHGAWVNSRALELAGITAARPTLPTAASSGTRGPASRAARCTRARPTASRTGSCRCPTRHEWERAILEAQRHLHALGITGWQDAWVTPATLEAYRFARRQPGG